MTREEAIKILMGYSHTPQERAAMEVLIPELAESEDESTRKALIETVKCIYDGDTMFLSEQQRDRYLAWLEQQKEQKPSDLPAGFYFIDKNGKKYYSNTLKCGDLKFIAKQKEQKSAECLKAERDGWYVCIKDYYRGGRKRSSVGDLVQAKGGMHIMGEKDISEWFRRAYYEEVRDAFEPNADTNIPEKPAEWSEEDENKIESIKGLITTGKFADTNTIRTIWKLLDSLRPLPKQEWSEEDEKDMAHIIRILNDCYAYGKHDLSKTDHENLVNKLKSLRPSWKPSEEQMEAFKGYIKDFQEKAEAAVGGWNNFDVMIRLFEQLKKLM